MTSVSQAVAQRDTSPTATVRQYLPDFAAVLPSHIPPPAFVRLAEGVLRRSDDLMAAARNDLGALMAALMDCARLGHEPGTPAYYLVPIKGRIEGWEGYRGVVERIYRAGAVQSVRANVVRENDYYEYEDGLVRPIHRHPRFASAEQRGPLQGVYAYAVMAGGGISQVVEMGRDEVMKHKALSKGSDRPDSPWQKWERSMWLKCAATELEKWVPSSTEYRREEARAAAMQRVTSAAPPVRPGVAVPERTDAYEGEVVHDVTDWPEVAGAPDEQP